MKWDMPIRPIQSGLTDREIEELNAFLLAEGPSTSGLTVSFQPKKAL
jgi:hypothetical protein